MTKITCALCGSSVDQNTLAERAAPEFDEHGIPFAASVHEGYGLPVVIPRNWGTKLNGAPVKHCFAFDRRAGVVWHYASDPDGNLIVGADDRLTVERLEGVVTVQPLERVG